MRARLRTAPGIVAAAVWVLVMAGCLWVWTGYTAARDPGDPVVFAVVAGVVAALAYGVVWLTLAVLRRLRA